MQLIVRLKGGLGKQMFQYAAARALAHRNTVPLVIDTTQCDHGARRFGLDVFNISSGAAYTAGLRRMAIRVACSSKEGAHLVSIALRKALHFELIKESLLYHVDPSVRDMKIRRTACLQ